MKNCLICGKAFTPYRPIQLYCSSICRDIAAKNRAIRYRQENRELLARKQREYSRNSRLRMTEERRKRGQERWRNYYYKAKAAVFDHYGWGCTCCGETIPEFLTIDHIKNDGAMHKKRISGVALYFWLVRNDFPEGFQTLCWNCNCAKGKNGGHCPHEKLRLIVQRGA